MNVNSIVSQTQSLSLLSSLQPQTNSLVGSIGAPSDAIGANLSSLGQFFNELNQLSTQNPSEFRKITAEVSQKLDAQAQNTSDPTQAAQLKALASRFDQASNTGDFSSLLPSQSTTATGGKHHGHHHHGSYESQAAGAGSVLSTIASQVTPEIQSALGATANTA
jgi:hypothetical protein